MERIQAKLPRINLRTRLMIISMMVYITLFGIMFFGVSNYAGVLWATIWADVPPQLVAQIQAGAKMLVGRIFLVVLPVWVGGSLFLTSRFSRPFVNLAQSVQRIGDGNGEPFDQDKRGGVFTSTSEMTELKGMVSSMMTTIRENDEQFRSIVSHQRELIFRWKPDFSLTFVNQAFCDFFGGNETYYLEASGEQLRNDMGDNYPELVQLIEGELLLNLEFSNESLDETYLKMPTGDTQWVQWRTLAMYDNAGNITECQSIGYVLTDLKRTQLELEDANRQLVALSQELIKNQEEERITVARFLHDQVLGELGDLARNPDENVDSNTVQRMISQLRSTIYMIRSPMLNYGLWMALDDLADHMIEVASEKDGVEFYFQVPKNLARFDPEVETQIYRIIQEASKNAFEHAGASEIRVRGSIEKGRIKLMVEDNGSGFEFKEWGSELVRARHFGMVGMEERCNIIGAQLAVESHLGRGTQVRVIWTPEMKAESENRKHTVPLNLPEI